ncbi:MAG TPA: hypothetical protein VHX44_16195 [Planctomycetota bacterium]|nr:hypothetical protein [Planctomycetota bacterium]
MPTILWIILAWVGISVLGAVIAALFMRGGQTGGYHGGAALDPLSTRRRRKRDQEQPG